MNFEASHLKTKFIYFFESIFMGIKFFIAHPSTIIGYRNNGWYNRDLVELYIWKRNQNMEFIKYLDRDNIINYCCSNKKGFSMEESLERFQKYLDQTEKKFLILTIMDKINYESSRFSELFDFINEIISSQNIKTVDSFIEYCKNNKIDLNVYDSLYKD